MSEFFSFSRVIEYFPKIIASFPTTLLIVTVAMLIGSFIGIIVAFIRINKIPVLYQISSVYISFVRGTPQIIQLFLVYYGAPVFVQSVFGININRVDAIYFVLVAYGINEGAFLAELFKGGLSSIAAGQYEAGYAAGLTKLQTFFRIIVPQAIRVIVPSLGVDIIQLFQGTSLASSVGVRDLMGRAGLLASTTRHSTENYFCTMVIFIVVSIILEYTFNRINHRLDYSKREIKNE